MPNNFTSWLYRPYIDLSPAINNAPLHVFGIDIDYLNLTKQLNLPRIQSVLMASYRESVVNQSGLYQYHLQNPLLLSNHLRTDRWQILCDFIENFNKLDHVKQLNTLRLLNKLCLYQFTLELGSGNYDNNSETLAEINYQKVLAKHSLFLDHQNIEYHINDFKKIADEAPKLSLPRINALYQLVIHYIKHDYNVEKAEYWANLHKQEVINIQNHTDEFTFFKLMSRQHRVYGFIPQMKNDKNGVIHEMTLAQYYAEKLFDVAKKQYEYQELYLIGAQEMLHPVLESRIKEALWLKDYSAGEARAKQLVEMCPNDPRARLHLGEILLEQDKIEEATIHYKASCMLGPPGTEVAWYMLGQCYESRDNIEQAAYSYMMASHYDRFNISSHEAIKRLISKAPLPSMHGFDLFDAWTKSLSKDFDEVTDKHNPDQNVQQYQHKQFDVALKAS